jgi:hypothetical protein
VPIIDEALTHVRLEPIERIRLALHPNAGLAQTFK